MKTNETKYTLTIKLTEKEIELLRNSVSDLGMNDINCVSLQLKVADAILDKTE